MHDHDEDPDDTVYDGCGECVPGLSRRMLLRRAAAGAAAAGAAGTGLFGLLRARPAEAGPRRYPPGRGLRKRGAYLLRGGYVVSMDPAIGNLPEADVLIRDGEILAVGPNLSPKGFDVIDASRMIVMPGFVDTHWHVWNSLQRNFLAPGYEYFPAKTATAPHYTPEDFYNSDMMAFAEAINAGITCIANYSHNTRTTGHVEAELQAHLDSGTRGRFYWSTIDGQPGAVPLPVDTIRSVYAKWFGPASPFEGLVDGGLGFRNPATQPGVFATEMALVDELGLYKITHSGQSARGIDATLLESLGQLDEKTILVHYVHATPEDRAAMARTGASHSYSIQSELRLGTRGNQQAQILFMKAAGVNISLSCDANSLGPISHFRAMNTLYNIGIPWLDTPTASLPPLTFHDVLEMATINGAKAMGLGDITGSLTPGKRADVICVRADDLNMVPACEVETALVLSADVHNVDTVFIDGRLMKREGRIVGLGVGEIIRNAAASAWNIRTKTGGRLTPPTSTPPSF